MFAEPVEPISSSGGTAKLVKLFSKTPDHDISRYLVGKDISHARGEPAFYEKMRRILAARESRHWRIFDFMLQYHGIHKLSYGISTSHTGSSYFIAMENLLDGMREPRLVDIKLGSVTSERSWFGKSCFAAWRIRQIDKVTNSDKEGFRLEGIDNPPDQLVSMAPPVTHAKASQRLLYQRLQAKDFLSYFLTFDPKMDSDFVEIISPLELKMGFLLDLISQLARLMWSVESIPAPQKWIGSSLVLVIDTDQSISRASWAQRPPGLKIRLLDWGRSELLDQEDWTTASAWVRADRIRAWTRYRSAVSRMVFESMHLYYRLFVEDSPLDSVVLDIFDYDSITQDDFIGSITISLRVSPMTRYLIATGQDRTSVDDAAVYIAITRVSLNSDIASFYRVRVMGARNLPRMDLLPGRSSDPYVRVRSRGGVEFGRSSVCQTTRDPNWDAVIDVPMTDAGRERSKLLTALQESTPPGFALQPFTSEVVDRLFHGPQSCAESDANASLLRSLFLPPVEVQTRLSK